MASERKGFWELLNKQVFFPPASILLIMVVIGLINPQGFASASSVVLKFTLKNFSWLYASGAALLLAFCLWAGFSKYGEIKLGGQEAEPVMSTWQWWAISLCAGLAIGITYFGVAEPMTHFMNPPAFLGYAPKSAAAADNALRLTFLHWTLHPYAIYTSAGLCVAFVYYNLRRPFRISSSLFPLIGERSEGRWGKAVDSLTIFAIVGGIATSLGFGTMQIAGGLKFLWGIDPSDWLWLGIIVIMTIIYTASSYSGLNKGIKWLSNINIYLYFFLLVWVIVWGPTVHILESTISAIGQFADHFFEEALYLDPIGKSGWHYNWPIYFWAWWLAFAPIVGLFLVRLAYGRTIKDFVIVNLVAPASFALIWFGAFGSTAIYLDFFKHTNIGEIIAQNGSEVALFALLEHFPLAELMYLVGIVVISISFITLADSMTSTIASMTTVHFGQHDQTAEPPGILKIFWGLVMGALSFVLLVSGGATALQTSVIVCGLPILVLQLVMVVAYIKGVKSYAKNHSPT